MKHIVILLCVLSGLAEAAGARYERDNVAKIVTDKLTGLQWQDNEEANTTVTTWEGAIDYCTLLPLDGYDDWRLPNISELYYLADRSVYNPALSSVFVYNSQSMHYWSSTTYASDKTKAWLVKYDYGGDATGTKSLSMNVRCVRGGKLP